MISAMNDGGGHDLGATFLDLAVGGSEDLQIRDEVHRLARDVIRPAARVLDRMSPQQRVEPSSPLHAALGRLKELGYHRLFLAPDQGGPEDGVTAATQAVVLEELGWGSLGLATSFLVDLMPFVSIAMFGTEELRRELLVPWAEDTTGSLRGCWAITEPDHGSDFLGLRHDGSTPPKGQLIATREEGGWRLAGQKSAWVSSAPVATHAAVHAQAGADGDILHSFFAVVPLDAPGIARGTPAAMLGARDDPQGEIFFDGAFVPDSHVLVAPGPAYPVFGDQLLCMTSAIIAQVAVGVARAAFEEALAHARARVQGGSVIAAHKNVQLTLYGMFEKVEAARAYSRLALAHVQQTSMLGAGAAGTGASPRHTRAAQIFAKRVAFEVANDAVQVCGAFGLSEESLTEKLLRDARCLLIEDGTLEVLALDAARDVIANYESPTYKMEEVMARW